MYTLLISPKKKKNQHIYRVFLVMLVILFSTTMNAQSLADQLYVFDFGLDSRPVPQRTDLINDLGYRGLVFNVNGENRLNQLEEYVQTEEILSGDLTIPVVFYAHSFTNGPDNNPEWKQVMNTIPAETDLWLIVNPANATPDKLRALLREASEEAARLGKDVVVYPHDVLFIEGVEDILPYLEELNLDNVFVTFHLCHELREGNKDRLREVFEAAVPYLKYVSVSGALNALNPNIGWSDTIRPLDDSELDLLEVVKILEEFDYNDPVVLHTFGINRQPEDHLTSSMKVWKAMTDRINIEGSFEAEDFAIKSGNVAIENTPNTTGDQNLGLIRNTDFVEYFVEVAEEGAYRFDIAASSSGAGGFVDIYVNNDLEETIQIPVNGNWHEYTSYSAMINLTKGAQRLKLVFRGTPGQFLFNIDAINVESDAVLSNPEYSDKEALRVYPNPSLNGTFYFNTLQDYQVFDLHGRMILKDTNSILDLSDQPKGAYFIRVKSTILKIMR